MDTTRFDSIAKLFAARKTRRAALKGGGPGLATAPALGSRAFAQEGTPQVATPAADPNDSHPSAGTAAVKTEYLFVQPFTGGTWAPKDEADGTYTLTLTGAAAQTVYFSDRPERVTGLVPMSGFLDGLGLTPANPPNAALVTGNGEAQDILVIELLSPVWDDNGTLTYDVHILADYGDPGLAHLAQLQADYEFPASFGDGGLFIDNIFCRSDIGQCYTSLNEDLSVVGDIQIDRCLDLSLGGVCNPCNDDGTSSHYGKLCAEAYPDQCAYYSNGINGWDCFASGGGL